MTTGPVDTAVRSVRLPTSSRTERPGVAERDARQVLLAGRLLGDVGALLVGLMVAQGIQQALTALRSSPEAHGPVGVFNTLAILLWLGVVRQRRPVRLASTAERRRGVQADPPGGRHRHRRRHLRRLRPQGPDPAFLGAGNLGRLHHRRAGHPLRLPLAAGIDAPLRGPGQPPADRRGWSRRPRPLPGRDPRPPPRLPGRRVPRVGLPPRSRLSRGSSFSGLGAVTAIRCIRSGYQPINLSCT